LINNASFIDIAQQRNIVQTAIDDGRFKILVAALKAADLVPALEGPGPFTVFAPPDAAFAKLPPGAIEDLLKPENKPKLVKLLTYHVVGGKALTAADILALKPPVKLEMLNGLSTEITVNGGNIKVNNATVIQADVMASNGIIHAVDTVILLPDIVQLAVSDGRFKILVTALTVAQLVLPLEGPGPLTVFAPTDAAFAKLPPGVINDLLRPDNRPKLIKLLTYHVVGGKALTAADIIAMNPPFKLKMLNNMTTQITKDGDNIKVNDATVIQADVIAMNGIIHAVDTVIIPPDIVQIASADDRFKILVTALKAADLVLPLESYGPFTVFAPTDDAFAKLPPGTIDDLLKPENKPKLIKILTYHVVGGSAITAAAILAKNRPFPLLMMNGDTTHITTNGGNIIINDANVIQADVIASNGVIHVIDTVLLPRGLSSVPSF
jgi:transforming growth factor-beta-induced protein